MTETWMPIPSLYGYEASDLGNIRRTIVRGNGHAPRRLTPTLWNNGYFYIQTTFDGRKRGLGTHRLVCEAFHGAPPYPDALVRHLDGNRQNNRPSNLVWGNTKENAQDRRLHGTEGVGSRNNNAKIDESDVIAIFCLRRRGLTGEEIGAIFQLDRNQVNKIVARTAWGHVDIPCELLVGAAETQKAYRPSLANADTFQTIGGAAGSVVAGLAERMARKGAA